MKVRQFIDEYGFGVLSALLVILIVVTISMMLKRRRANEISESNYNGGLPFPGESNYRHYHSFTPIIDWSAYQQNQQPRQWDREIWARENRRVTK